MSKFRDIALIDIVGICLACVGGSKLVSTALPEVFPETTQSDLEERQYQSAPELSMDSISSGEFQDSFEQFVADSVPVRDTALTVNAALQRTGIKIANIPFGYDAYPTYLGSDYSYVSSCDALVQNATKQSKKRDKALVRFAKHLKRFAKKYPEKRFAMVIPTESKFSASNTTARYIHGSENVGRLEKRIARVLRGVENVTLVSDDYHSSEEFFKYYYRTDNHWNIYGAARTYNEVASELGIEKFYVRNARVISNASFSGAWARLGLDPVSEQIVVEGNDYSEMVVHENDGLTYSGTIEDRMKKVISRCWGNYSDFYVEFYGVKRIDRIDGLGTGSALMVSDSFGGSFQYLLANSYDTVTTSWDLHGDNQGDESLSELLESSNATDVFFVANAESYRTLKERYPNFWK
jgi:hypothetical protein